MQYWIFQGNPDLFDVDSAIIQAGPIYWSVRQTHYKPYMNPGDEVFIWRAGGRKKLLSGIVAKGYLIGKPMEEESNTTPQQDRATGSSQMELRVRLILTEKCIEQKQVIPRDEIKKDPVLSELGILKQPHGTNYRIKPVEAERLSYLIKNANHDLDMTPRTYTGFGDAPNDDPQEIQEFAKKMRRGQPDFRKNLLAAYGSKCAITDSGPSEVLEAVHIIPHAESGINELDNGLLMRADVHILFDEGLLRIEPNSLKVVLGESLLETPYKCLDGKLLRKREDGTQINCRYLRKRWDDEKVKRGDHRPRSF